MILSLKNIYKLLMYSDFPIYSECVIHKRNKKGQTLVRFWRERLTAQFYTQPYGRLIWRNDGGRNRHISEICNRSGEMKYYRDYARELCGQLNEDMLLGQIRSFTDFLHRSDYAQDVFLFRVKEFLRLLRADACVTETIHAHLTEVLDGASWAKELSEEAVRFHAGYLLAVLTIYAAAGEAMGDAPLARLRASEYSLRSLWEQNRRQPKMQKTLEIITEHCSIIEDHPLASSHFFGREDAFLDLREMVCRQSHCLISGMGGVGKTEMLRQLVRWCREEGAADALAVIAYQNNFAESLRIAFPNLYRQMPDEGVSYILRTLARRAQDEKLLIVVDDIPSEAVENELEALAQLPCAVVASSRRRELDGFETYRLPALSKSAGSLIFRDDYGQPLSESDRAELFALLDNELLCQPLVLHLMAKAAAENNWSLSQLCSALEEKGLTLSSRSDSGVVSIEQLYARLYKISRVPAAGHALARLFTLLPRDSYSADFLQEFFPSVCAGDASPEANLARLASGGWLESDGKGYSMHPLIAQSLRPKTRTEKQLEPILRDLHEKLPREEWMRRIDGGDVIRTRRCLLHLEALMTGSISAQYLADIADVMFELEISSPPVQKRFRQKMAHCTDMTEEAEFACVALLCRWSCADEEQIERLFFSQQRRRTVSAERFQSFCTAANSQLMTSKPELAEQMLQAALHEAETSRHKAVIYRWLVVLYDYRGDSAAALRWAEMAADHVCRHPECGEELTFNALVTLAQLYLKFGQVEKFEPLLEQMESLWPSVTDVPVARIEYCLVQALYERFCGRLDRAENAYERALPVIERFYGRNYNYFVVLGELAIVYQQQKKFDAARQTYERILSQGEGNFVIRLNYAVLLLDMEKPEEAMRRFDLLLPAARRQGGLDLGETLRSRARAFTMLGDTVQERQCLEEAYPILAENYGAEHPRTVAARERLAELND